MTAYAETAEERGLEVIIAGAGGKSADLPNMTASIAYPLPVIGVPVQEKSVDSVIGMPTGAPLVAVDAGKSFNAALSAAQILARQHDDVRERLVAYHEGFEAALATSRENCTTPERSASRTLPSNRFGRSGVVSVLPEIGFTGNIPFPNERWPTDSADLSGA